MISRRQFIRSGAAAAGALALGPSFFREALAQPARPGAGPYGPLLPPDSNGLMLPEGFSSRLIARGNTPVQGTTYVWHFFPDGSATYDTGDGGWIMVSNSEVPVPVPDVPPSFNTLPGLQQTSGGASAIRFRADGSIAGAYRILAGTKTNCAGGPTPWGTWLSCEEVDDGRVWECDPTGERPAVVHPAMGVFKHEACAVDPDGRRVYLSEDLGDSGFYRFTPDRWPDLSSGLLEIATVGGDGVVTWTRVPDPSAGQGAVRQQVPGYTQFKRGEGMWFDSGIAYLCTTSDSRIHAYDTLAERIDVLYDGGALESPAITGVDNITVSRSGDIFVCEDNGDSEIDIGIVSNEGEVARFLTIVGSEHSEGELAGVSFNPAGDRMYFSSQRAAGPGATYEVTGPFRTERPADGGRRARSGARVRAARAASLEAFEKRGLTVAVLGAGGFRVSVRLRAMLGSAGSSRTFTLARRTRTIPAGLERVEIELKPSRSVRERLRGRRRVNARLDVLITREGVTERLPQRPVRLRSTRGRR